MLTQTSTANIWSLLRAHTTTTLAWVPTLTVHKGEALPLYSSVDAADETTEPTPSRVVGPPSPCEFRLFVNTDTWGLGLVSFKIQVSKVQGQQIRTTPDPASSSLDLSYHVRVNMDGCYRRPPKFTPDFHPPPTSRVDNSPQAEITGASPTAVFKLVLDHKQREKWDVGFRSGEVVDAIDNSNAIVREAFEPLTEGGAPYDYALVHSWRVVHDSYVLAMRSVIHDKVPVVEGYERGELLTSGFILQSKNQIQSEQVKRYKHTCGAHAHAHAHAHANAHARTHARTHTHARTRTHARNSISAPSTVSVHVLVTLKPTIH